MIVVSDGFDEASKSVVVGAQHAAPVKRYFEIPKSQQGAARNFGVKNARGKYVMFIGDDIFLAPDACERHMRAHNSPPPRRAERGVGEGPGVGVLGFTTWDPACGITPVMRWLETSGWQFGYPMLAKYAHDLVPADIQHRFTYTSHISLPMETAKKFPFRDDVTLYGWEDIEWGWRLAQAGVPLFYEPDAKAFHHHHMTMEDSLRRMQTLGKSAVVMDKLVPELKLVPSGWKLMKYRIAALLPTMRGKHAKAFLHI